MVDSEQDSAHEKGQKPPEKEEMHHARGYVTLKHTSAHEGIEDGPFECVS
ncbi:MAG: hypothetical protein GWN86_25440 [Desulfobacterales bacterium]|nr:hypothetical protein [Desulfobacterales bacterium]